MAKTEDDYSNTRFKLLEAEYFLDQIRKTENETDPKPFLFNLSACLTAARSIVCIMRKEFIPLNKSTNCSSWCDAKETDLNTKGFRDFVDVRDIVVHRKGNLADDLTTNTSGYIAMYSGNVSVSQPIVVSMNYTQSTSEIGWYWSFQGKNARVIDACQRFVGLLSTVVEECEGKYQWW